MEFRLLGPLELVGDDGRLVELPAGKPRLLLALLLLDAGRVVSVDRLVAGLWGERPPATAGKLVQGYVSRLRKLLPRDLLETREPGYRLCLADEQLDLSRFERLRREGGVAAVEGRWQAAGELLTAALALWRGPALADVAEELRLPGELARLEELRLVTLEERIDADLALGQEAELVAELEALVAHYPLRERLRYRLMLALYRVGRQADALSVYRETRRLLVEELGIEPGAELQRLERQILAQDEALASEAVETVPPLPVALTPLVGRLQELAEVGELLRRPGVRLVTFVGPGGVGKTRLALAVAEPNGGVFVPLAPVQEPTLVRAAITHALGLKDETTLAEWLRSRELLLVLDNFEHLLDAAPLVNELLGAAPGLRVLATSRASLSLSGEHQYLVAPLPTPDAVALFVECAAATGVDVGLTGSVEEICRRLDCLPLAIELAAARSKTLPPEELLARLEQRLPLLVRGSRDLPERQQTLRATIEWSYGLLQPDEQTLFARLAVFAGGCTLKAAEQVCDASLETLEALVENSLLQRQGDRFTMLETILEFAAEQLEASHEAEAMERRHAGYFLALFESHDQAQWERRESLGEYIVLVRSEQDNARRALAWFQAGGDFDGTARLVAVLHPLWMASPAEGRQALDTVLARSDVADDVRGRVVWSAWTVAQAQEDDASAKRFLEEALPLSERLGDRRLLAEALTRLGWLAIRDGEFERGRALSRESVRIAGEIGDRTLLATAASNEAHISLYQGDFEEAGRSFEESLRLAREAVWPIGVKVALLNIGLAVFGQGRLDDAASKFRESLSVPVEFKKSSADAAIDGLAAVAVARGDPATSARLLGATEEWRRTAAFGLQPFEATLNDRTASAARRALGENAYRALAEEGAMLELDAAIELALATADFQSHPNGPTTA